MYHMSLRCLAELDQVVTDWLIFADKLVQTVTFDWNSQAILTITNKQVESPQRRALTITDLLHCRFDSLTADPFDKLPPPNNIHKALTPTIPVHHQIHRNVLITLRPPKVALLCRRNSSSRMEQH